MICNTCVLGDDLPNIKLDDTGECQYCKWQREMETLYPRSEEKLQSMLNEIKSQPGKYKAILGCSGGSDSSYLMHLMKKNDINVLCVTVDDTWNTITSQENLMKMLEKCGFDYEAIVLDMDEINSIYKSFLLAGLPDIDAGLDIAIASCLYKVAEREGVKYILDAHSFREEATCPPEWLYMDSALIESVNKKWGTTELKTYPHLKLEDFIRYIIRGFTRPRLLYNDTLTSNQRKEVLRKEYDWEDYGIKHGENIWCVFSNYYYMPRKFNMDLRRVFWSAQIRSGQMTREDAIEKMEEPHDNRYTEDVLDRLDMTKDQLEDLIRAPQGNRDDYETYLPEFKKLEKFFKVATELGLVPMTFFKKYVEQK